MLLGAECAAQVLSRTQTAQVARSVLSVELVMLGVSAALCVLLGRTTHATLILFRMASARIILSGGQAMARVGHARGMHHSKADVTTMTPLAHALLRVAFAPT